MIRDAHSARTATTSRSAEAWLAAGGIVLITVVTFWPGLQGGFVSDMFGFLEFARHASLPEVLDKFKPVPDYYYRPLYFVMFWALYAVFSDHALGYLLVSFAGHLLSGYLLYRIGIVLALSRAVAALSALAFLISLHAHEPILEVSQLHFSLGSCLLLASVLNYLERRLVAGFVLAVLTVFTFEGGLLILPLVSLYEWLRRPATPGRLRRIAPLLLLTGAYLLLRYVGSDVYSEATSRCQSVRCVVAGPAEYLNRLFVRPEAAVERLWTHRIPVASATFAAVILLASVLRPWTWRHWPRLPFAFGWLSGTVVYFLLALWPYVSDRFLYIPNMGLALCIGVVAAEVVEGWPTASRGARLAAGSVAALLFVWLLTGAAMIHQRGERWSEAAAVADRIVNGIHDLQPDVPAGSTVCVVGLPDSLLPEIAPGNTGAYIFRNGLPSALYHRYGRRDFAIAGDCTTGVAFRISEDGTVAHVMLP
jgi:hypothetical protein